MKVACTVREGAVGKGPMYVGTSLAAYFISWESRPTRAIGRPDHRGKEHRCLRSMRREACEMHRAVPARKPAASAVAGTGKRNATKAARCVWGGADGKGSQDTSPAAYSTWRGEDRKVPRGNSLASYPVSRASMALKAFGERLSHGRHDTNGALANATIRSAMPATLSRDRWPTYGKQSGGHREPSRILAQWIIMQPRRD